MITNNDTNKKTPQINPKNIENYSIERIPLNKKVFFSEVKKIK